MNGNQQAALAELRTMAPIAQRLDRARDAEDRAADILELWQGTESALRALLGDSGLSGQALIRELRQRELISLGQAYSLLEFLGARDRANRTTYKATENDVEVAKEGFRQLESGLSQVAPEQVTPAQAAPAAAAVTGAAEAEGIGAPAAAAASASRPAPPTPHFPPRPAPAPPSRPGFPPAASQRTPEPVVGSEETAAHPRARRFPQNTWIAIALAVLILGAAGGYLLYLNRDTPEQKLEEAVAMLQSGRREAARGAFTQIARENENLATPHVFLARLAREEGDVATARRELETAIRLEPTNAIALREMGLILFSTGNYEVARRFFIRAIQSNPDDKASQGYLGCALSRLGRFEEANRFITRAGPGSWTACTQPPPMPAPPPPL